MQLRWGIAGASKAAHNFCAALQQSADTNGHHRVIAVASRCQEHCERFARDHRIERAYGSYQQLALDPDIEVIYVAVLSPQHHEVIKLMVESGKHVVCAKPFAMNHTQAQDAIVTARKCCVFIMEGMWSRFFPVYRHMATLLDRLCMADVREVYVKHGFPIAADPRIACKTLGGGIVLELGCYAIQFVLFALREEPKSIRVEGKVNAAGVDLHFEAAMLFSGGRSAHITCSGLRRLENQATVITTKGPICIPHYWCPTMYLALGKMHDWPLPESTERDGEPNQATYNSAGLRYEADEVKKCIRSGQLECDIMPTVETLRIAKIQDEIRKQLNVQYDCDK